ncbi:MAG: ABC transporter permease [Campylobacteraceae bacterium]|jgi:taurine transport system permease protein|nr:ABC transporter permease [Campylobacteraceae bacterium]
MKNRLTEKLLTLTTVTVIFAVWYFVTKWELVSSVMIPSPKKVIDVSVLIWNEGYKETSILKHLFDSLQRLLTAFFLATAVAVPLGLASGYSSKIAAIFEPIVEFLRPLPPLAYYTLIVLWMGIDDSSKIALLALAAFAPIFVSCVGAMQRVKKGYINNALMLGASKWQLFFYVSFPSCLPEIFVGIRTALGVAYTTLVAAEMVAAVSGIGWLVLDASRFLRSDIIFMGIFLMGITGVLLDQMVRFSERKIVFWKGQD